LGTSLAAFLTTPLFKDDFFLKFHPLDNAIGPGDIGTLMQALEDFAPTFKQIWKQQVETKLLGGGCKVDVSFVLSYMS